MGYFWKTPVHPHVHGELISTTHDVPFVAGSSPRAWGTLGERQRRFVFERFIPTCMGNSLRLNHPLTRTPVHPHVHGELDIAKRVKEADDGSSPRAWGTQDAEYRKESGYRFIPTCMGNSEVKCLLCEQFAVHPHVHGELGGLLPDVSYV